MEKANQIGLDYEYWAKKILYFYGLLAIVAIGGQLVGLIVTFYYYSYYIEEYISLRMIWPTSFIIAIILICWFMVRVLKIFNPYILFFAGTLLAVVMILANPGLPGLQMTLLLPMAISLIYLKKFKLTISFLTNFVALLVIYLISEDSRTAMTPYEYFAYLFILVAGFIVYLAVIERGTEVLSTLRHAAEKEEDLLIQNRVMERLSKTDALTGLYNHKTFQNYLDTLVQQAEGSGMQLQLAVLDIDNFKSINDNFGHSTGDSVLKHVAEAILEKAGAHDIVARYGGEEFAVIFTEKTFDETLKLLEEIRKGIAKLKHPEIAGRRVTISAGLQNHYPGLSKSEFFKKADAYLYDAKGNGKNQIQHNRSYNYII
ncbi:diguanylate cyclase [Planomicrobium sp. Y74]|uniref:GGDEF domain-containing protein n=1 Tax=Planomicrobium sp. Y74 TaxID=2478977 RepID=UPI000EF43E80|nr:diguanylate cyclase [Planomicrobium sp. Y74]RLQ89729.1 sensor domain-containing diguanylate cyclase [Planomicrobium sp. Y74]